MKLRKLLLAASLFGACYQCPAQEPVYTIQTPLVLVPVTVSERGERIYDLKDNDFQLLDNGQERTVKVEPWGSYRSKISLVVLIETSALAHAALLKVKKTASMLDSITGEAGEVAVITADADVKTPLEFSSHWESIQETFEKLKARETDGGRVLDGVDAAVALLAGRPPDQRRLILLMSEARDRGSKTRASDVLTQAEQQNVTIYTASYSAYVTPFTTKGAEYQAGPMPGGDLLALFSEVVHATKQNIGKALAEYTGGRQLSFATLHRLEDDLAEIGKEVHSQYLLSSVPEAEQTPVYHQLTIKVRDRPDALVRARPGYWSGTVIGASARQ